MAKGDDLVEQGYLVENTLLQDYQDANPDYDGGMISLAAFPFIQ